MNEKINYPIQEVDESATWTYWSIGETNLTNMPEEWIWERLRNRRNRLLAESDYRLVSDAPWDRAAWQTYRKALRDLPDVTQNPRKAQWPIEPNSL